MHPLAEKNAEKAGDRRGGGGAQQETITTAQRQRMDQISAVDDQQDRTIELIGDKVDQLGEIAKDMNEVHTCNNWYDELLHHFDSHPCVSWLIHVPTGGASAGQND